MYIAGDARTLRTRLRNSILWLCSFFGGRREMAKRFSSALRYETFVDSGRSGNVNCRMLLAGCILFKRGELTNPNKPIGIPMSPS